MLKGIALTAAGVVGTMVVLYIYPVAVCVYLAKVKGL